MAKDKFLAFSGIAIQIRKATHSEYIAGLWNDSLDSDWLWQVNSLMSGKPSPFALGFWQTPSFPWTSLHVPVAYNILDEE
jgi:hypothetical protein